MYYDVYNSYKCLLININVVLSIIITCNYRITKEIYLIAGVDPELGVDIGRGANPSIVSLKLGGTAPQKLWDI